MALHPLSGSFKAQQQFAIQSVSLSYTFFQLQHFPLSPPPPPQAKRKQRLRRGLGQDGGAVAEGERGRGAEENPEDDTAAVTQPHDREHTHVHRRRRHTSAGWNGPIGHGGGRRYTPLTWVHPLYCGFFWIIFLLWSLAWPISPFLRLTTSWSPRPPADSCPLHVLIL